MDTEMEQQLELNRLKTEFSRRGLTLEDVWYPMGGDVELHIRQLRKLLDWVEAYELYGDRETMEEQGYEFPPVHPCIEPESDWLRFERWMAGEPVTHTLRDYLPRNADFPSASQLNDAEVSEKMKSLLTGLEAMGLCWGIFRDIPIRLQYAHLLEYLDKPMEILGRGVWHLDGCDGFCPGCFQRPWCEFGGKGVWPEDEEAGEMYLAGEVRTYVSSTPFSLKILEEDKEPDIDIDMDDPDLPF